MTKSDDKIREKLRQFNMSEAQRTKAVWQRLEKWLRENFPAALDNLREPASEEAIASIESRIQMKLPEAMRVSCQIHDGEEHNYPPGILADGFWLMPLEQAYEVWEHLAELAAELFGTDETPTQWKSQVEDGIISIKGAVKPLIGSPKWFPFADANGDIVRFLDFDPPQGGIMGQVIEVDAEGGQFQVIAPSFLAYLEHYADELEAGHFDTEEDGYIKSRHKIAWEEIQQWGLPEYLKNIEYDRYDANEQSFGIDISELDSGEEITIIGKMGKLMGGAEIIFSLQTEDGREYTFLAQPKVTKGYRAIAVRQYARVRAQKNSGQVESVFAQYQTTRPDFVALEYTMLKDMG
jgi:cell wall assembly regulator SMI1